MTFKARRVFAAAPRVAIFACALIFTTATSPARASAVSVAGQWFTSYDVTLDAGFSDVTNILMLEHSENGGSTTWAFTAPGDPSQPRTTTLNNPFPSDTPIFESLLIGLVQDLPNDAPGQMHLVLMMDNAAAGLAADIAFGTLFRHYTEEEIIAAVQLATSGQDWPIITPGLDKLGQWAGTDATYGILTTDFDNAIIGPDGPARSAWFATGGSFTVVAFSDGTVIGSGTSTTTFQASPVPEPSTAFALLTGLGLAGFCRKAHRRQRAASL